MNAATVAPTATSQDAALNEGVVALAARGAKAERFGSVAMLAGGVCFAASWWALRKAGSLAPSQTLTSIHLPAEIVQALNAAELAADAAISGSLAGVPLSPIFEMMDVFVPALTVVLTATWMTFKLIGSRWGKLSILCVTNLAMAGVYAGLRMHSDPGVVDVANAGRYEAIESAVRRVSRPAGDMPAAYVLAQTGLMRAQAKGSALAPKDVDAVRAIAADVVAGNLPDVSPKSMYALETSALGSAVSPMAKAHAVASSEIARRWETMSRLPEAGGVLGLVLGLPAMGIGLSMKRRARRLAQLLKGQSEVSRGGR